MARRVYRGASLDGINTALRDSGGVPYTLTRKMRNFSLTDKRMIRRNGFGKYSTTRYIGSQISQPTSALMQSISGRDATTQTTVNHWVRCPTSYGLIKYHSALQPNIASDWSVEFLLTLGEKESFISNGYYRQSLTSSRFNVRGGYDGSSAIPQKGAYVFDQSVISNECVFSDDSGGTTVSLPKGTAGANNDFDTVALPALAVSYYVNGSGKLVVEAAFTLVNTSSDQYYRYVVSRTTAFTYTKDDAYHILVTWDASTGIFTLKVSDSGNTLDAGSKITVTTANRKWVGEADPLNKFSNTHVVPRDIVILNESTIRGKYSSTCSMRGNGNKSSGSNAAGCQNILMASSDNTLVQPNSWALSPTKGTGLSELRFWSEVRSDSDYVTHSFTNLLTYPSTLKVYLPLNDGVGYCRDLVSDGGVPKNLSIHSTLPQWVVDDGLLSDTGLHLADNQFVIHSIDSFDYLYTSDAAVKIRDIFTSRRGDTDGFDRDPRSDFTAQIQIRTPVSFQANIAEHNENTTAGGQTTSKDSGLRWWDGSYVNSGGVFRTAVMKDANSSEDEDRTDGYYATLFSVEGVQNNVDGPGNVKPEGSYNKTRIPLVQALLDPSGKIHFRVFHKRGSVANDAAAIYYVTSATALSPNTVYTITVRKATELRSASTSVGTYLDIFIDGTKDANVRNLTNPEDDSSFIQHNLLSVRTDSGGISRKNIKSSKYDVILGASKVNDVIDEDIAYNHDWTKEPDVVKRSSGHFMGSFSDQPGFFTLGFFRLWSVAISDEQIAANYNTAISDTSDASLVYNLELNQLPKSAVDNSSRYDATFELGYKSFGDSFPDVIEQPGGGGGTVAETIPEVVTSLGSTASLIYKRLPTAFTLNTDVNSVDPLTLTLNKQCKGLGLGSDPISRTTGVLSVFGDSPQYAKGASKSFGFVQHDSLLSEYKAEQHWDIVNVNDKTFIVGAGGRTKFFDGSKISVAGPTKTYNGSFVVDAVVSSDPNAGLDAKLWYAVYLAYFSELYGYYHILGPEVLFLPSGKNAISISLIPDHFDPNVSSIAIYRSPGQSLRELAERVDPVAVSEGPIPVKPFIGDDAAYGTFILDRPDDELFTTITLDRTVTPIPNGLYAASHNNRLFIAGLDNKVYWSDPNAPHRFSAGVNFLALVEKNSGPITGIVSALGSVYVFKLNSIWKIDAVGTTFRAVRVSDTIGCVAPRSISPLTLNNGQGAVFFWSAKGPQIVNGVTIQDISSNIEGELDRETFDWLLPESVVAVNDVKTSQLICLYKTSLYSDVFAEAVVFDYRLNTWFSFDSMLYTEGVSVNLIDSQSNNNTEMLWGGDNGLVYNSVYAEHRKDGLSSAEYITQPITAVGTNYVSVVGYFNETSNIEGLWATIYRLNNNGNMVGWFTAKVIFVENNVDVYYSDKKLNAGGAVFTPAAGDFIIIGVPPTFVEFPWDVLEEPVLDKEVTKMTSWGRGLFYFTYNVDWTADEDNWKPVFLEDKLRTNIPIKRTCEAGKLTVVGVYDNARLDAFNYMVSRTRNADRKRRA